MSARGAPTTFKSNGRLSLAHASKESGGSQQTSRVFRDEPPNPCCCTLCQALPFRCTKVMSKSQKRIVMPPADTWMCVPVVCRWPALIGFLGFWLRLVFIFAAARGRNRSYATEGMKLNLSGAADVDSALQSGGWLWAHHFTRWRF
jgi:hypothetical protein